MSAFNTVSGEAICPSCGVAGIFNVQFKYGNTWQIEYALGDELRWGGNQVGDQNFKKVAVEGISEKCPSCNRDMLEFDVIVENNKITKLIGIGETREFESELGYRSMDN